VRFSLSVPVILLSWCLSAVTYGASPASETLFPITTKGWVSVPNIDTLRANFGKTQLGTLVKDPIMQPFMEDLNKQLGEKIKDSGIQLGISLDDLEGVYAGEVGIGLIQPNLKDINSHAIAMVVDVTDKQPAAADLLKKIDANLIAKKAVKAVKEVNGTTVSIYTHPLAKGQLVPKLAIYALQGDTLLVADNLDILVGMLSRLAAPAKGDLGNHTPFKEVFAQVNKDSGKLVSDVRWFIEPLGFAEVNRAAGGGRKKRGTDPLVVLRKQGFSDLQGLGGNIHFATERHETLHHSFLYAPTTPGSKTRLTGAANVLEFPNTNNLTVQPWVPNGVSTYLTFNWNMQTAFNHFAPLFDGFTEPGTFEEILAGLEEDPSGPQINIRKEIVGLVNQRVTMLTDYQLPIDTKCERLLVAFELKPEQTKAAWAGIHKLMHAEPNARKIEVEGHEVWEIAERLEEADLPMIEIDGAPGRTGFVAFEPGKGLEPGEVMAQAAVPHPQALLVTVAHNHIFIGTHADMVAEVLKEHPASAQLANSADFNLVQKELAMLGSGNDSFRFFTRTDEAYRPTYELLQQGKLPVAETMLARVLNRLLAAEKKGEAREAVIDGKKMPDFGAIRQFFGPGGFYAQTVDTGWKISGCLIQNPAAVVATKEK
jgi:hypothetical protein